jgi:hypothetical protein
LTHNNRNDRDTALFYENLFRYVGQIIKEDDKNQPTRFTEMWSFTIDLPIFPKAASYGRSLSRIENKVFKFFHMSALALNKNYVIGCWRMRLSQYTGNSGGDIRE